MIFYLCGLKKIKMTTSFQDIENSIKFSAGNKAFDLAFFIQQLYQFRIRFMKHTLGNTTLNLS
jgi:hypothetical protein